MDRSEKTILTNMCMIFDDDGNILVQDKKMRNGEESPFPAAMWKTGNPLPMR